MNNSPKSMMLRDLVLSRLNCNPEPRASLPFSDFFFIVCNRFFGDITSTSPFFNVYLPRKHIQFQYLAQEHGKESQIYLTSLEPQIVVCSKSALMAADPNTELTEPKARGHRVSFDSIKIKSVTAQSLV